MTKDEFLSLLEQVVNSEKRRNLLQFFHNNPGAMDDLEGLARWMGEASTDLKGDVEQMVMAGILQPVVEGGSVYRYTSDPLLHQCVAEFLARSEREELLPASSSVSHQPSARSHQQEAMDSLQLIEKVTEILNSSAALEVRLQKMRELLRTALHLYDVCFLLRGDLFRLEEGKPVFEERIVSLRVVGGENIVRSETVRIPTEVLEHLGYMRRPTLVSHNTIEFPFVKLMEWLRGSRFVIAPICIADLPAGLLIGAYEGESLSEAKFQPICALLLSVTHQVAAELRNARFQEQLTRTRNSWVSLLQSMETGVIAIDSDGITFTFNVAAERIFAVGSQQVVGIHFRHALGGFFNPRLVAAIAHILDTGESLPEIELDCLNAMGGVVTVRLRGSALRNELGERSGAVLLVEDITNELKRRQAFSRILPPRLAQRILEKPEAMTLEGKRQEITVCFADIHGFTTLAERLPPEQVMELLNEFFEHATEVVFKHDGTLDNFLGDGVLAFFGAPQPHGDDPLRAVRAALELKEKFDEMNERRSLPEEQRLSIGVGINTGEAIVGFFGSEKRVHYTAIGDSVNIADRLQKAARPSQILISRATFEQVKEFVVATELGEVAVKGRSEPVYAFVVEGLK